MVFTFNVNGYTSKGSKSYMEIIAFLLTSGTVKPVLSKHLKESQKAKSMTGACLIQINMHLFFFNGT